MQQYTSHSLEETLSIARQLGRFLKPGTVVAYLGGLGMGKTAFTAGLAQGMGIEDSVSSPTFSLVNVYYGHPTDLVHFDMYRISSPDDLDATGFFDYLDTGAVLAVEWSENILSALPVDSLFVHLAPGKGEGQRVITFCQGEEELEEFLSSLSGYSHPANNATDNF
jgi:hydrolase, P-loop family